MYKDEVISNVYAALILAGLDGDNRYRETALEVEKALNERDEVITCKKCLYHHNPEMCPMCHTEPYYDVDNGNSEIVVDNSIDEGFCDRAKEKIW